MHELIRKSFFLKFLLITILLGNVYVGLQCLFHVFQLHFLDDYLRWYPFKASGAWHLLLLSGTILTLIGTSKIYRKGREGYSIYVLGKVLVFLGYLLLIILEYRVSALPFPWVLVPILLGMEAIYPIVLYLSLRQPKNRRAFK
jgi:hypothetical protein